MLINNLDWKLYLMQEKYHYSYYTNFVYYIGRKLEHTLGALTFSRYFINATSLICFSIMFYDITSKPFLY